MLAVVLIAGLIVMLLKDLQVFSLDQTWSVVIAVVCLAIAIVSGARDLRR